MNAKPSDISKIIKDLTNGKLPWKVAKQYKTTATVLFNFLVDNDVDWKGITTASLLTKDDIRNMQELRNSNFTLKQIAEKFECSTTTVSKYTYPLRKKSSIYHFRFLDFSELTEPVVITKNRKVIGTFIPNKEN